MKKIVSVLGLVVLLFGAGSVKNARAQNCLTEDWAAMNQTVVHGNSMAFDPVSRTLLIPQVNEDGPIYVFRADDGSLTTRTLAKDGIRFGPLGCFAIATTTEGTIYGYTHSAGGAAYVIIWNGVADDHPTSVALPSGDLARNLEVYDDGNDSTTIYAVGQSDSGPIDVFEGPAFGPFTMAESLGDLTSNPPAPGGKSGVAADGGYPASVVFGSESVGTQMGVHIWKRIDGTMTYEGDVPFPSDVGTPAVADVAYDPSNDGLIFALICDAPNRILAINAKTFQEEGRYEIPVADAVYQRGSLVVDRADHKLYWYGRPSTSTVTAPLGSWGRLSYTIPPIRPAPTPSPSPTATPPPSPTPTPGPNPDVELRALWVTRWDYTTTDDVKTIIRDAAETHFNVVLWQCRGNATVFYKSSIEPWAWELSGSIDQLGRDPGWDPLAVAIAEAHARGLQLHAYMNTYPAWRETTPPPPQVDQVWNTHRDWICRDSSGTIMWPSGWWSYWYTFLSPGHPAVQDYLNRVYMEVLRNYPVDGIHYDYVRYPGEVGDWSWNPVDVSIFTAEAGGTPLEKPDEWAQWKRDQVTKLVRRNYFSGLAIRPGTMFSAAVAGNYTAGRDSNFQDSHAWLAEGIIDCIMPMEYTSNMDTFRAETLDHVGARNGRLVAAGISVSSVSAAGLLEQIQIARDCGAQGVALFAYSTLFPGGSPSDKAQALLEGPFSNIARVPAPLHLTGTGWMLVGEGEPGR